jgi:DNA-binding transcriptional MocR family regulator
MSPVSRVGGRALAAQLADLRTLPGPVYAALANGITALVLDGRIATETRLPSERELALALQISRATVTAAYDALRADGYLASRTGSGSFVTVPGGSRVRPSLARWSTPDSDGPNVFDLSCGALHAPRDVLEDALSRASTQLTPFTSGDGYEPSGLAVLRQAVADRFTARGVPTGPEQILITNGALHGLDLLLRLLIGPGDRVLTELPTYPGALDAIRGNRGRVIPVPMAAEGGWQVDLIEATLRQTAPRVAYLTPDFHNPTGALVDEAARRSVFRAARRTGTTVVVDESFVDLGFRSAEPASAGIDSTVITIGSLSKPVWGGLRVGWLRASTDLVHRLAELRVSIDMGGAVIDQLVAANLFERLDEIVADRVAKLRPQRDALTAALARELPQWRFIEPSGGLSLWVELDAPLSTPLTLLAAQAGVLLVPGSRFGVDGTTLERFLRVPFVLPADRLDEAVQRLAQVWDGLDRSGISTRQLVVA